MGGTAGKHHEPEQPPGPTEDQGVWVEEQVAELLLLLPGRQAAELERRAHSRGLTVGQLICLLIRGYLTDRGGLPSGQPRSLFGCGSLFSAYLAGCHPRCGE